MTFAKYLSNIYIETKDEVSDIPFSNYKIPHFTLWKPEVKEYANRLLVKNLFDKMAHAYYKTDNIAKILEAIKNEDAAMLRFLAPMEENNRRFWNGGTVFILGQ